jgi:spore maturation protein CgeB
MGSKGLLFTNYQPELMEYFENGRELVIYDDAFDALEKAQYFLEHPDEAMDIRGRGLAVIMEHFTYRERFETMFRAAQVGIV